MNELEIYKLSKKSKEHYNAIKKLNKTELENEYMKQRKDYKQFGYLFLLYLFMFLAISCVLVISLNNHTEQCNSDLEGVGNKLCSFTDEDLVKVTNGFDGVSIRCDDTLYYMEH